MLCLSRNIYCEVSNGTSLERGEHSGDHPEICCQHSDIITTYIPCPINAWHDASYHTKVRIPSHDVYGRWPTSIAIETRQRHHRARLHHDQSPSNASLARTSIAACSADRPTDTRLMRSSCCSRVPAARTGDNDVRHGGHSRGTRVLIHALVLCPTSTDSRRLHTWSRDGRISVEKRYGKQSPLEDSERQNTKGEVTD